jgi:two-component system, NtrC family, sensor kinase
MLEHSRTSTGKKEFTDINALADEYLRLAYHGLRAKDKDFNAEMVTEFDPDMPKIEVIPQDIGRVLLNLINNAFQAVDEASSTLRDSSAASSASENYRPTVTVSTKNLAPLSTGEGRGGEVELRVTDNGPGIPHAIKDKIFQPFFTTKDTGKGTGLGLSLAYDIVKAHGGEIKVASEVGKGSEFIILLPIPTK